MVVYSVCAFLAARQYSHGGIIPLDLEGRAPPIQARIVRSGRDARPHLPLPVKGSA